MRTSIPASLCAILALAAGSIPVAASAFLMTKVIQPAGVGCTAVKIVSANAALSWAAMNCTNGLAYIIKNKNSPPALLALPAGATSERVYDVAIKGWSVGSATFAVAPFTRPVEWNPAGAVAILSAGTGTAAGLDQFDQPIVGFKKLGPMRAFWYGPGAPHVLGAPPPPSGSFAYDVNRSKMVVGQFGGVAAVGLNPALPAIGAALPGTTTSVAYAINETNFVVGHADVPGGGCNGGPPGAGFMWQSPGPPAAAFGPLGGDCTAGAEDDNDAGAVVGYSQPAAGLPQAVGFKLAAPFPPPSPGFANLNAIPGPWVRLTDAPGVDNANSVIATDGGAAPTQVYILN